MSNLPGKIIELSAGVANAAIRQRVIARLLKKRGFCSIGRGAFLGLRGQDIVSGLLVDKYPSDVYISSFILPVFDKLDFISWGLGRRIIHSSINVNAEIECSDAVKSYLSDIFPVKSAEDLVKYLEVSKKDGFYPIWVRYISSLRLGNLEGAKKYLNDEKKSELHPSVLQRLAQIEPFVISGDRAGVSNVLNEWENFSRLLFGQEEFSLNSSV
jgi:hypothetical protein